jgi:L-seryl-tRNA(Ser) seleniumtransferase
MTHTRRTILKAAALSPVSVPAAQAAKTHKSADASIYTRLGVKPVINGMGTVTVLGGSLMPPEVLRAMDEAAQHFIHLPDLQKKAGARIAELIKVPAAMVTGGAAASITVAAVACMTRGDHTRLQQLPRTDGIPYEVIQQKTHRSGYEHQMTLTGARIITVETRDELMNAINPRTAMLFFLNKADPEGQIRRAEWISIGKQRGVPTFNDAAADVPGKDRLLQYVNEGFDLVTFSGGKGLRGPQSAGLLLGTRPLIEAATEAQSPYGGIGRGMKVGKEEIVGMVAAIERYMRADLDAEARELDRRVSEMISALSRIEGVRASKHVPQIANEVPHLLIEWDENNRKPTSRQVHQQLQDGEPSIWVLHQGPGRIVVSVWVMRGEEHRVVARRLGEIFRSA